MKINRLIITLPLVTLFIGCGASKQMEIKIKQKPKLQLKKTAEPVVKRKGALYSRRGASLFADKKEMQVGDIIQVLINEEVTNESSILKNNKNESDSEIGAEFKIPTPSAPCVMSPSSSILGASFKSGSKRNFKASSKNNADELFETTISAVIQETYQNGNYLIYGSKEMVLNGDKQMIEISGIIRPYDITTANTIYSNQLANLKISYHKLGEASSSVRKPWGTKLVETIWPF